MSRSSPPRDRRINYWVRQKRSWLSRGRRATPPGPATAQTIPKHRVHRPSINARRMPMMFPPPRQSFREPPTGRAAYGYQRDRRSTRDRLSAVAAGIPRIAATIFFDPVTAGCLCDQAVRFNGSDCKKPLDRHHWAHPGDQRLFCGGEPCRRMPSDHVRALKATDQVRP
jgi:hypothetical protein